MVKKLISSRIKKERNICFLYNSKKKSWNLWISVANQCRSHWLSWFHGKPIFVGYFMTKHPNGTPLLIVRSLFLQCTLASTRWVLPSLICRRWVFPSLMCRRIQPLRWHKNWLVGPHNFLCFLFFFHRILMGYCDALIEKNKTCVYLDIIKCNWTLLRVKSDANA